MTSFGARLRAHREEMGVALEAVAAETKISASHFAAMERGDLSRWPSGIFARGFVRAYAQAVGLDPVATLAEFGRLTGEPGRKGRPATVAVPSPEPAVPTSTPVVIASAPTAAALRLSLAPEADTSGEPAPAVEPSARAWLPVVGEATVFAVATIATWWWASASWPLLAVGLVVLTYYAAGKARGGQRPVLQALPHRPAASRDTEHPHALTGDRRRVDTTRPAGNRRQRRPARPRQTM